MRNLFREYRDGLITWDEAYATANNMASTSSMMRLTRDDETEYWAEQMDNLAVDAAGHLMDLLGYKQNDQGAYYKPGE